MTDYFHLKLIIATSNRQFQLKPGKYHLSIENANYNWQLSLLNCN